MSELVPLERLRPHPRNARRGNVDAIRASLRRHGQYRSIVAQRSTGYVLAGNHTYAAMAAEGWGKCVVDWFEGTDEEALEILRDDNATSDLASYDQEALDALLEGLPSADLSIDVAAVDLTPGEPAVSENRPGWTGKVIEMGDGPWRDAYPSSPTPEERDPTPVRVVAALPHWARSEVYAILDARARQGESRGQTLLRLLRSAS